MKQLAIRLGAVRHAPSRWLFGLPCFLRVERQSLLHYAQLIERANHECRYIRYLEIR